MRLYTGGAVDYAAGGGHAWRHAFGVDVQVYCPICAAADYDTDIDIMRSNQQALMGADRAVFLLDGTFTIGTPVEIEIWSRLRDPRLAAIVHPDKPGLFVRQWHRDGFHVVRSMGEAVEWLRQSA